MATYWEILKSRGSLVGSTRASDKEPRTTNGKGMRRARWSALLLRCGCIATVLQWLPLDAAVAVVEQEEVGTTTAAGSKELRTVLGSASTGSVGPTDLDESPEGRQRIVEIENRASQLFGERDDVERERRPFALRRDSMLGEAAQARERLVRSQVVAVGTERQIARLDNQIKWATGSEEKELRAQLTQLRASLNTIVRRMNTDRKLVEDRLAQISALNLQIASLDRRLVRLEEELSECRKQWLGVRQPLQKYSRCDFEGLRRVLDDWLVMDGQWPEAFAWAALCAYELDDIRSAAAYLEKAQKLRLDLSRSTKKWPQFEALTALIRQKQPNQSAKAEAALANALRLADKDSDWEVYFLVGRYYSERPEDGVRAQTHFQRALAIQSNCDCAKLWLARLQTTSTIPAVRDLYVGTTCLDQLWEKSGRRSWRIASFLAEAYSALQRTSDAKAMWSTAAKLAPAEHKHRLVSVGDNAPD